MRIRNTIIVLALFAIVGGYAFIVAHYSKPEETQTLFKIKPEQIAKIQLRYPDQTIELERPKDSPWRVTKPIGVDADQSAANNLARAIAECQVTSIVDEKPENLVPFGLANPETIVTISDFAGKTFPGIEVGKLTPVGFSAYIKTTDKPAVMLTSSAFPPGMKKSVDQLRNRDLMTFKVDNVQRMTIAHDNGEVTEIVRDGDKWKIVKPARYNADATQVRRLLSTLVDAKAADFIADAPGSVSQYGLEKPHLTVAVYLDNGGEQSLLFGFKQTESGKDGIYVRRGERTPVYTVAQWVMSSVNKSPLDLRDKTVMAFEPSDVESVKVKNSSGEFILKRAPGGKWDVVENGTSLPADVAVAERFLEELRDLKGQSIIADPMPNAAAFGLDQPAIDVTVYGKDGKPIGTYKLSKISIKAASTPEPGEEDTGPRNEYYAASSAGKAVYSLSDFGFSQLNKSARLFRSSAAPAATSTH